MTLPLLKPGMVGAGMLLFIIFVRELSTSIFLYSPGNEVLSVLLFNLWTAGDWGGLSALAMLQVLMMAIVAVPRRCVLQGRSDEVPIMSYLSVQHLVKTFGDFKALNDVSIDIERGKVCALLGPSGCGKTTTLRCIAGLETADSGRDQPRRPRAVRSSGAGSSLRRSGANSAWCFSPMRSGRTSRWREHLARPENPGLGQGEIRDRVASGSRTRGHGRHAGPFPANLSGGQQQRVALARALTLQPKCILFDEPLSNLDLLLRERMRFEIRELLVKLGITAVYVTHDQTEALVISDHIVVMNRGGIEQEGAPMEVYARPRNRFTAEFLGRTNVLPLNRAASDPAAGIVVAEGGTRFSLARHGAAVRGQPPA